ncbi:hypothetical protein FRACYDRAFT_257598 [Fragilariopsis cylindrus CCMP1102]|uniref:DDE Tnp4 domain-containing protein n=1 Tax=Fragilariopsis cylindrus CCMP1102 TaxID=635003 RepID=A0A1E7EJ14_9STRA|nr:hypothetical protein FRACYDRAFT_257598 [Fragilariopsis cylindrus CCMP1102]|eukprot:OEU05889.1 hypothetical protein FRACYDRAFT_257598 [Fragilariopsis cylindrus CCMP1102]
MVLFSPTKKDIKSIEDTARAVLGFPTSRKWESKDKQARFKSLFGANSTVITAIWNEIQNHIDEDVFRKHLLYGLLFMKVYSTEEVHCAIVGWPSVKTFREKAWHIVECIAELKPKLILIENRFINAPPETRVGFKRSFLTDDACDFGINEPYPWDRKWYAVKFNGPGVKYNVAIAIHSDNICYASGPHFSGESETTIFKENLGTAIPEDEPVEIDGCTGGDQRQMKPQAGDNRKVRKQKSIFRGRQETIFSRMKQFNVLNSHFRHNETSEEHTLYKHQVCFDAILVITQLKFMIGGDQLFDGASSKQQCVTTAEETY